MNWKKISTALATIVSAIVIANWIDARYVLSSDFKKVEKKINGVLTALDEIRIDQLRSEARDIKREVSESNQPISHSNRRRLEDIDVEIDRIKNK